MSQKEHKEFKEILRKQREEVTASKEAAQKFQRIWIPYAYRQIEKKYRPATK